MRSRALILLAVLLASAASATAAPRPSKPDYLALAEDGVARAHDVWWNPRLGWYDEHRTSDSSRAMPLATLWSAFPLFEATIAIAVADPTPQHVDAVRAFARRARRYWNPAAGGYAFYPGMNRPNVDTYFDDNGWWGIAFTDAWRATGDRSFLADARRALRFIVAQGWDGADGGGTWWDTRHHHRTIEPLAAAALVAARLYAASRDRADLQTANRMIAWADERSWDAVRLLYTRSDLDGTLMPYAEGLMIGAQLELCRATGVRAHCARAEALARASVKHFGTVHAKPHNDAIYLRFLLDLYREDGNRRWYDVAARNARRALLHAGGPGGLYLRDWLGRPLGRDLLRTHAATVSLFAWLAAARAPVQ